MQKVQTIEIGGAMANTFLKAKGYDIGSSKYEADKIEVAKQIMKDAFNKGVEIILPKDARVVKISLHGIGNHSKYKFKSCWSDHLVILITPQFFPFNN